MEEPKYTLIKKDYFELWKQFQEDADKVKDKLWTITSWLYALMSGLIVFLLDRQQVDKVLILVGTGIGVLLSWYTWYMIKEFGEHIQNHWKRADSIRKDKINGLSEIWKSNPKDDKNPNNDKFPEFAQRLIYLAIGYGLIFVLIAIYLIFIFEPVIPATPS